MNNEAEVSSTVRHNGVREFYQTHTGIVVTECSIFHSIRLNNDVLRTVFQ
jgi:hypothetical protein